MEILSYIALILLSLVGYSGGAAGIAGKTQEPKPRLLDLAVVFLIWGAAIFSRAEFDFNRWLLIPCFLAMSILLGLLSWLPIRLGERISQYNKKTVEIPQKRSLWQSWKDFSKRMGGFQSRFLLSLFYFLLVTPFALIIKFFSDPLRFKEKTADSLWLSRQAPDSDLEDSRRQF